MDWRRFSESAVSLQNDKRRLLLLGCLAAAASAKSSARIQGVELYVASDGDEMRFLPDRLVCVEGAMADLHFHHAGRISSDPHDWVLLKSGALERFLAFADQQTGDGHQMRFGPDVLAATPLCARGATVHVKFVAPPAGEYPFVCSVPAHGETMHGTLLVKPSI